MINVASAQTLPQTGEERLAAQRAAGIASDSAEEEGEDSETVVVTGTRIVRPNTTSAAPISTTTAQEIRAQGAVNIEEALQRLPQVGPLLDQSNQDSEGRQAVGLRNLGGARTLVLIDGLRLGMLNGQDVGIIPTTLVERIDVLSGGASSVYGSDAISGVINFILKKNFEGLALNTNYNFYAHTNRRNAIVDAAERSGFDTPSPSPIDGQRADISLTAGKSFFDGRVNINGFVNYRTAELLPYGNRSASACQGNQVTRDGPVTCTGSTYSPSGFILPLAGANANRSLLNDPAGSGRFIPFGPGRGLAGNPFDGFAFQRQFERYNAGGFLTAKLADWAELYGTGLWYRDESSRGNPARVLSYTAFGSDPYQVNCNNPFLSASQSQTLCGAQAGADVKVPLDVRYRFDELPDVLDKYTNQGLRATAGVRGAFAGAWNYDVAVMYSRLKGTTGNAQFPDFAKVNRSIDVVDQGGVPTCRSKIDGSDPACVPFNAFSPGVSDPALYNYLLNAPRGTQSGSPQMWQFLGVLSGDLTKYGITSPLAERGVALAATVEHREELFRSTADAAFRQLNGGNDVNRSQKIDEASIEAQLPLVEKRSWTHLLQINAGYRISKYNRLSGSFGTWKIEGLWAPIEDITFRASINKAQRAPTVFEVAQATDIGFGRQGYGNDPCASTPDPNNPGSFLPPQAKIEACRATGLPDNLYGSTTLSCPDGFCTTRSGGFDIRPETARTKTFGVLLRPRFLPGLVVSVDRYIINLDDSIGFNYDDFFTNGCIATAQPFYCNALVRNPGTFTLFSDPASNPTTGFIRGGGTQNLYKASAHGWDSQAQYDVGLGSAGRLGLIFNATLATEDGSQDAPDLVPRNCVGYFGPFCGAFTPKWQHSLRTTYTTSDGVFSLSGNWRHSSALTITYNVEDGEGIGIPYTEADRRTTYNRIGAYDYFDLSATVTIAKQLAIQLAVNNLLDKDPPLTPNIGARNNTVGGKYDYLGRQIVIGTTLTF